MLEEEEVALFIYLFLLFNFVIKLELKGRIFTPISKIPKGADLPHSLSLRIHWTVWLTGKFDHFPFSFLVQHLTKTRRERRFFENFCLCYWWIYVLVCLANLLWLVIAIMGIFQSQSFFLVSTCQTILSNQITILSIHVMVYHNSNSIQLLYASITFFYLIF